MKHSLAIQIYFILIKTFWFPVLYRRWTLTNNVLKLTIVKFCSPYLYLRTLLTCRRECPRDQDADSQPAPDTRREPHDVQRQGPRAPYPVLRHTRHTDALLRWPEGQGRRFQDRLEALLPWTVPQLLFMIIYNCTWSILIQ